MIRAQYIVDCVCLVIFVTCMLTIYAMLSGV